MDNRVDLAGALAVVALGVTVLVVALTYTSTNVEFDAIGPMGFPIAIGSGLILAGLIQSLRSYRSLRLFGAVGPAEGTEDEPEHPSSTPRAMAFIVGAFLYLLAFQNLGFFVATIPALALALWAMDYRNPVRLVLVTVGFSAVAWFTFAGLLNVPLPAGPVEHVLEPLIEGV